MNNEIEAQFLDINKDEVRKKLTEIGAKLVKPEVLMRRFVFDTGPHSFARVRDEGGGRIVMTYKNVADDHSIMGTKEVNVVIDDYEKGVLFMRGCGLEEKAEQESLRETWVYEAEAKFGSVDTTYQHYYGVDTDTVNLHTPKILFDGERPDWAKEK